MPKRVVELLFTAILISMLMPGEAHAYIDLGTGSYAFQVLIAFILGGLFSVKVFWRKLVVSIRSHFSKEKQRERTSR